MDMSPYVENLRRELLVAGGAGGEDARALAERLIAPLESGVRLTLLEALSAAADEITRELAPGSVELRLRGGEPEFAVTPVPAEPAPETSEPPLPPEGEEAATARINLRLPEQLKAGIEQAAARERLSVNAWAIRVLAGAVANPPGRREPLRGGRVGQSLTGWVS